MCVCTYTHTYMHIYICTHIHIQTAPTLPQTAFYLEIFPPGLSTNKRGEIPLNRNNVTMSEYCRPVTPTDIKIKHFDELKKPIWDFLPLKKHPNHKEVYDKKEKNMPNKLFLNSKTKAAYQQGRGWTRESTSVTFLFTVTRTIFRGLVPGSVIHSKPAFKCILTIFNYVLSWHNLYVADASTEAKKKAILQMSIPIWPDEGSKYQ